MTAEFIQYKIGRTFDVDDILLNVIGAVIGYFGYILVHKIENILPNFLKNEIFYNFLAVVVLVIIGFFMSRMWGFI